MKIFVRFAKDRAERLREYCSRGMILLMSEHRISVEVGSEHIPRKFAMDRFRGEYKQFSLRNVNVMCIKHFLSLSAVYNYLFIM